MKAQSERYVKESKPDVRKTNILIELNSGIKKIFFTNPSTTVNIFPCIEFTSGEIILNNDEYGSYT